MQPKYTKSGNSIRRSRPRAHDGNVYASASVSGQPLAGYPSIRHCKPGLRSEEIPNAYGLFTPLPARLITTIQLFILHILGQSHTVGSHPYRPRVRILRISRAVSRFWRILNNAEIDAYKCVERISAGEVAQGRDSAPRRAALTLDSSDRCMALEWAARRREIERAVCS